MEYIVYYFNKLFTYIMTLFTFIIILYGFIKYKLSKEKQINENLKLFGLFSSLSNREVLLLSISTIRYIFLLWCLLQTDYVYIFEDYHFWFLLISNIFFDIINNKFYKIPISIFNNVVIYFALALNNTLYNYNNAIDNSFYIIIIMVLVLIFIFLYSSYFYIKDVTFILKQNKYSKKKEE